MVYTTMKIKNGFVLKNICGESMVIAEGKENIDFSKIISLNESAAFLWNKVEGTSFTPQTLANLLVEEYDVSRERALADAETLASQWLETGIADAE